MERAARHQAAEERGWWSGYAEGCNTCLGLAPPRLHRLYNNTVHALKRDERRGGPLCLHRLGFFTGVGDVCDYVSVLILSRPKCAFQPITDPPGPTIFRAGVLYERVRQGRDRRPLPSPGTN